MTQFGAIAADPNQSRYDVVIIGGAMMGSAAAWFLASNPHFDGSVLVVERDTSYSACSTVHTNSCIRQQFSNELNIRISQYGVEFVNSFPSHFDDPDVPELATHFFGYMYLAASEDFAAVLRTNQARQAEWGAGTKILTPDEIAAAYPFYNLDDIVCGSHNLVNEGYFDGGTMFDVLRRQARLQGTEYIRNEVVAINHDDRRVASLTLASGQTISCGVVINAAGPRAATVAAMAGFELPVEPRKRFSYVFDAAEPLDRALPLTIDPTGVHVRSDGGFYVAGCSPFEDHPVEPDDFTLDHDIWEQKVWPVIASRIPAFERVKVINRWAGHYAYNTLDQNVVVGPHPDVENFIFMNGFSGHGLQQSPAMGRGVSELVSYGDYRSLDLSPLGYQRILDQEPFVEKAVI